MIKHSIVLVPFPFDDLSDSKVRPALCLTVAVWFVAVFETSLFQVTKHLIRAEMQEHHLTGN